MAAAAAAAATVATTAVAAAATAAADASAQSIERLLEALPWQHTRPFPVGVNYQGSPLPVPKR
jgi:hypothetical protein